MSNPPNLALLSSYLTKINQVEMPMNIIEQVAVMADPSPSRRAQYEKQFDNIIEEAIQVNHLLNDVETNADKVLNNADWMPDLPLSKFVLSKLYDTDQEKFILNKADPLLAEAIEDAERVNTSLKTDLQGWIGQFVKQARLTERAISENVILRKTIKDKNGDLIKVLKHMSPMQAQFLQKSLSQLGDLTEQSKVLVDHFVEIRSRLDSEKLKLESLKAARQQAVESLAEVEINAQNLTLLTDHSSKSMALLQDLLVHERSRKANLIADKEHHITKSKDLIKLKAQFEARMKVLKKEQAEFESDLKPELLKKQKEKNQLHIQIDHIFETLNSLRFRDKQLRADVNDKRLLINKANLVGHQKNGVQNNRQSKGQQQSPIDAQIVRLGELQGLLAVEEETVVSLRRQIKEEQKVIEQGKLSGHRSARNKQIVDMEEQLLGQQRISSHSLMELNTKLTMEKNRQNKMITQIDNCEKDLRLAKDQLREISLNQGRLSQLKSALKDKRDLLASAER